MKEQSIWTCDKDRITLKVRFIDSLSCILARHRAMGIIKMGIKFHSKKIGHRTVQILSESKDSNDEGVGGEDYLSYKVSSLSTMES